MFLGFFLCRVIAFRLFEKLKMKSLRMENNEGVITHNDVCVIKKAFSFETFFQLFAVAEITADKARCLNAPQHPT